MFRAASLVFKDGELVVRDGTVTHYRWGRALTVAPGHDRAIERRMQDYYSDRYGLPADIMAGAGNGDRPTGAVRGSAMREMIVKGIHIDDTFAEAFNMRANRSRYHCRQRNAGARQAAVTMIGFGTSVIGCGCEAGIDSELSPRGNAGPPARHSCASVCC